MEKTISMSGNLNVFTRKDFLSLCILNALPKPRYFEIIRHGIIVKFSDLMISDDVLI